MTSPQPRSEAVHRKLLLLAAVGFSAFVYYPITRNYFYADDFLYLFQINNVPLLEFLLTPNGGHAQFARNLLFYLSGSQRSASKTSTCVTHSIRGWPSRCRAS